MHRRTRGRPDGPERLAARSVAAVRLAILLPVAAGGSFAPHAPGRTQAFYLLVGLVAVPWAIVVLFATESERRTVADSGWFCDLLILFALQTLLPQYGRLALGLAVGVLIATGYLVRTVPTRVVTGVALALALTGRLVAKDSAGAGELVLFVAVAATVTVVAERVAAERRNAAALAHRLEGRAAAILDKVADAVVLTDVDGTVRSLNPAARKAFGAPAYGTAHCSELLRLHLGERALDCSAGCALLANATDEGGVRVWRPLPDERRQPLLASAALVEGGGEVVHSLRDITKLVEADEAKTLFLATASHELKTPLTVITGFATTLLRRPNLDKDTRDAALVAIHRRSLELSKIVDRLLLSSRIEAGKLTLSLDHVDVVSTVTDRVEVVRDATGREVFCTIHGDIPPAYANTDAVATVLDHLVDNGLKYAPEGSIGVGLSALDGVVVLTVSDTGVGMDEESAERCFDKFWQAEAGDARRFGGTGIGLYIVRSLVEAMSGSISVRSALGAGTTFEVRLPTQPVPRVAVPDQRAAGEASMIREFMRQIGVADDRSTP